jgi:FhaA, N-terminal domain/FHA domain
VSALHRFEQRLETLVTGAFARAFRSAVQPMEIAAALQREVDNSAQILSREKRLAPNDFLIDLSPTDFDRLSAYGETLSSELAQMLHEHAEEQRYLFAGAIQLKFQRSEELTTGRFRVRSSAVADVTPVPGQSLSDTAVRRAPVTLEVNGIRHPLEPPGVVIGRGSQADLRIDDPGVSRRHAEFRVQPGPHPLVSIVDLGSTNGTVVNGRRVQHAILDDGAVVQLGGTTIRVQLTDASPPPPGANPQLAATTQPPTPPRGQPGGGYPGYPPADPHLPGW